MTNSGELSGPAAVEGIFEPGPIEVLERWQRFGATWRVVARTAGSVTLSFCRCDGGEEIQRMISTDPDLLEWLGERTEGTPSG